MSGCIKRLDALAICAAMLLAACAPSVHLVWRSVPEVRTVSKPAYTIQVTPFKNSQRTDHYIGFRLTLQNSGADILEVDWNQSRYIHKGEDKGLFIFKGIDPASIKGHAIAPDKVAAGEIFSREIFPLTTLAFIPLRDKELEPGASAFKPGLLPGGDNSVRLILRQGDRQWQEDLAVRLVSREEQ